MSNISSKFRIEPQKELFRSYGRVIWWKFGREKFEKMFEVDSLGSSFNEDDSVNDYDKAKIKEFENSILYRNNVYHVELPWHEEKIKTVPSNFPVALKVLEKTDKYLESKNLIKKYNDVFYQQESEGIIERIKVIPSEFFNYNWIPHRLVIKLDTQVTTKIRPVFNCSLKNKGSCSLNEAAYPGMNLLSDMLRLLLLFKTNKYVMLADIRKAFLMIMLNSEKDKNRFFFFLKEGDELLCFRYTTLIFGFNASPFIPNFVLKHHAERFPKDSCTDMLLINFYVDNLSKKNWLHYIQKL